MTLRYESYWSLLKTRQFLRDLLTTSAYPKTKKEMRARAYSCLRHYPFLYDDGRPMFSRDPFLSESEKQEQERKGTNEEK